jgi:hypothetical protein
MTIDRALSGNPFKIDQFRCRDAANSLRTFRSETVVYPWSQLPTVSQIVFKTLFVSICQQFNWDFLQSVMAGWLLPEPERRLPTIATTRPSQIAQLLSGYGKPERIRGPERARMLRETALELQSIMRAGLLDALISKPKLDGEDGFYSVMGSISAFAEDELEKKIRVLAHDLHRENILVFIDPENLRPAVEYHILRLYLRTGRVYPADECVREQLQSPSYPSRARLVKVLRRAVEEAMALTALYAGMDVAILNYVEWQIGRTICTADAPYCNKVLLKGLPSDVEALCSSECAFAHFCRSYTDPKYGWYHEPHFQKAIY